MRPRCIVDGNISEYGEVLCEDHLKALQRLKESYSSWVTAMGELDFNNYLRSLLAEDVPSGEWIKEIAEQILEGKLQVEL